MSEHPCLDQACVFLTRPSDRLGHGIYFGNADTAASYAGVSLKRKTAFMLMLDVALGKMKDYTDITYGLSKPPAGFHSCHGVGHRVRLRSSMMTSKILKTWLFLFQFPDITLFMLVQSLSQVCNL
jgi:hypothetical protein